MRFDKAVADIAVEAGVRHLVYTCAGIISQGPTNMQNLDCKLEIEAHLRSTDIAATIVRPGTFMNLLTLRGMGLDRGSFTFLLRPDQAFQIIAVQDIGKIVATIFGNSDRFAGRTIEIAGDEVTDLDLQDALSAASGRPIAYHRCPDELLARNAFLRRNVKLFDEGRAAGNANIAALKGESESSVSGNGWPDLANPCFRRRLKQAINRFHYVDNRVTAHRLKPLPCAIRTTRPRLRPNRRAAVRVFITEHLCRFAGVGRPSFANNQADYCVGAGDGCPDPGACMLMLLVEKRWI